MNSNPVQAWIFFRLSFRNCLSCVVTAGIFLLFDLSSAVQIYVSYIYIHLFILYGYITKSQYDQLPVGWIAQLVEHCTGIAEVMGSNPVQAWIFFRLSFRNCLSCVVTARIFLLFDLSSAVHSFIHPSRVYYELIIWPSPSWLDSSVSGALHRHRRGHGFESRSSLNFFQAFFSQLLKLRSNCEDLSSIWSLTRSSNICFIYLHSFIHRSRVYYELTIWPALSCLDSSVGGALHRHRRGNGFESRLSLNFFQAFFSQLLKLRSNCEDLSSIWSFIRSSFIYSSFTGILRTPNMTSSQLAW